MLNMFSASVGTPSANTKSPLLGRFRPTLLTFCMISALLLLSACSDDKGNDITFPIPPPEVVPSWLFDVSGTGANDVYVGGASGIMYHFDGSTWTLQDMGTTAPITSIWTTPGGGAATVYAVGHGGHIWRNTGTGWSGMNSGTTADLYGVGSFGGEIHAVGANGTIRRLNGSSWGGTGSGMLILDENGAPTDTLVTTEDLTSMLTVNRHFLGGAYFLPNYTGSHFGILGTTGLVLAPNTTPELNTDWILRPISGEQTVANEWVLSMASDVAALDRNYMGTSEGWLFRLTRDDNNVIVWQKAFPAITSNPGAGVRDIWVDATGNVYAVTDDGEIVFQSVDYDFSAATGSREVLFRTTSSLVGIWGSGPDNFYVTAFLDELVFRCDHDAGAGTFSVETISLPFPDKVMAISTAAPGAHDIGVDHIGRPLTANNR